MNDRQIVNLIWREIQRQDISNRELLDACGYGYSTVTSWVNGKNPRIESVVRVLDVLEIELMPRRKRRNVPAGDHAADP